MKAQNINLMKESTKADWEVVLDVHQLCAEGAVFYKHLVDEVDDYNMSRLFTGMSCLRWAVVCDLRPYTSGAKFNDKPNKKALNHYYSLYCYVQANTKKIGSSVFIEQLQKHEMSTLWLLKLAVKRVELRSLSIRLSTIAADVQVENDMLEALKKQR